MAWRRAFMVLTSKSPATYLRAGRAIPIAAAPLASMPATVTHRQTLPFTHQILIARNIFLEAPTPAGFLHYNPTSLNTLSTVAPLRAAVIATWQHLLTSSPTNLDSNITRHSLINPFPTRTRSLPLKGTLTTLPRMTPSLTNMLPTPKPLLTRIPTLKNTITTLPLLLHLPTPAREHATCPARRAAATVANLNTAVDPTI